MECNPATLLGEGKMKWMSLFSGIGGFDLALRRCGHELVGACEIDGHARRVYAKRFPGVPIWENATKIKPEELPDFDGLAAGFPCQTFSVAGKRLGFEESRGTLFYEIARIAKQKRPRFLLLENVKGLLSHDGGKTLAEILATLDELGYDAEWEVLNSKRWVPQNRERIFIIGYPRGTAPPKVFPVGLADQEAPVESKRTKVIGGNSQSSYVYDQEGVSPALSAGTHGYAMGNIAVVKDHDKLRELEGNIANCIDSNYWKGRDNHGQRTLVQLNETPHDTGRIYDTDGLARTLRANSGGMGSKTGLYAVMNPGYENKEQNGRRIKDEGDEMFTLTAQDRHGVAIVADRSRNQAKLGRNLESPKSISNSLTSATKDNLVSKDTKVRRLTPLECERLQGFPDNWTEGLSDTQRYKCCGNAVTVPVVEFIIKRLDERI
jgi:DNA (cytosine-5)-methyltransferase 1